MNTKEMRYEIDPPAAEVVRRIFMLYNSGWGYKKIANYLTDEGIPTPRANEIAWKEANGQKTKLSAKVATYFRKTEQGRGGSSALSAFD